VQRGEIWLVSLDPTAGHEQQGTRPVVVVSPAPFNELTGTPVVLPITTGGRFAHRRGFAVSLDDAGTRTVGVIRCDQPRALDLAARNGRCLETDGAEAFCRIRGYISTICKNGVRVIDALSSVFEGRPMMPPCLKTGPPS
jgi:mRNA interferase ChpB